MCSAVPGIRDKFIRWKVLFKFHFCSYDIRKGIYFGAVSKPKIYT